MVKNLIKLWITRIRAVLRSVRQIYGKNNASGQYARQIPLLSPIRTITVGPGITPDLLTSTLNEINHSM
ncbi:hypothetical protein PL78_09905 [Yersinia entomophaga]|uniref:Uncharacterized protein n=1 Tax=Yersinia entomophaga TaxID=935293 RepID=A0ABN4PXA5_YERET|nr:hypothetical protein PL78_09905 [Yersinia entomophaga]